MRWTVDITGIDIESDLGRESTRFVAANKPPPAFRKRESLKDTEEKALERSVLEDGMGEVWVLQPEELLEEREIRVASAPAIGIPSNTQQQPSLANKDRLNCTTSLLQSQSSMNGGSFVDSPRVVDIKVFCTFLSPQNKRTAVTITMTQGQYRGVDIVYAFLMQAVASDERQSQRFSTNPRLYRLFIADEFSGEEEAPVQLDNSTLSFTCYAVSPLPAAQLYLLPQRTELLPATPYDINLLVNIRTSGPQSKPIQRHCVVPADMLAESLESTLARRLPASAIVQGSLRIKYGPLELNINEYYNFGAGCGQPNCPIAERTMLSLYRFGVSEVVVSGRAVEVAADSALVTDGTEEIKIDMSPEQAVSLQQFDVVCITRYGARQQRVLCVDGEHLYTMRPNSETVPSTTERPIKDIDQVRVFPNKPKYIEIEYTKASKYETDRFECTTAYSCALLAEKLRVARPELRKGKAETATSQDQQNAVQRMLTEFRTRLFKKDGQA